MQGKCVLNGSEKIFGINKKTNIFDLFKIFPYIQLYLLNGWADHGQPFDYLVNHGSFLEREKDEHLCWKHFLQADRRRS